MSNLWKLDWKDFWKGIVLAIIVTILGFIAKYFNIPVVDTTGVVGAAIISFVSYLFKNWITTKDGKLLGL